jgi:hypothetical protein
MTLQPEAAILRQAMLFSLTRHAWSNRREGDKTAIETTADKKNLNMTKRLLNCKELDAVNEHLNAIYEWCFSHAMQSRTRKGIYFVKRDMIPEFEARLAEANRKLREDLVPALVAAYPAARESMRLPAENGGLGDLFKESDYPTAAELAKSFYVEWSWLALSVPNELPEEVRQREVAKLRESMEAAQQEVVYALRVGFKKLVDHAVERLTPNPDGSVKVLRESTLTGNFEQFFEAFHARDLMGDSELSALVDQARAIVKDMPDSEKLRKRRSLLSSTAASFKKVGDVLDTLIINTPIRKFDLEA